MSQQSELAFLAEAGRALGETADLDASLERLASLCAGQLAGLCMIDLLDDPPRRIAVAASTPAWRELADGLRRYPPGPANPLVIAWQRGEPVFAQRMSEALRRQIARDEEHARLMESFGPASVLAAPLVAEGRPLGMITVARPKDAYSESDKSLLQGVAQRAAATVANARLRAAEHSARDRADEAWSRTQHLQLVTSALACALAPQQVAHVILDQGLHAMGACAGAVCGLDEEGTGLEVLGFMGYDPDTHGRWVLRVPLSSQLPLVIAYRTGQPVFVHDRADWAARFTDVPLSPAHASWAALPLLVGREVIGSIGLSFAAPRPFDEEDRAFLSGFGGLCAQALHRARLYAAERSARAAAEEAVRVREDFLSIAAHELRTPLTPLLLQLGLLRREFDGKPAARKIELALRQTERLSRLATNLLDVARVAAGSFSIERAEVDLGEVAQAVVERHADEAERLGVRVELDAVPVRGQWDGLRLDQVVTNLLSNALRHAGGKPVVVRVRPDGGGARLTVQDSGAGIPRETQGRLFQRFARAAGQNSGGLGLGLYISRQIALALGGALTAESVEGQGATFTLELPGATG